MSSSAPRRKRANGTGSIFQRKSGAWIAAVLMPSGRRHSFYATSRAAAELNIARALEAMDRKPSITDAELLAAVQDPPPARTTPHEIVVTAPPGVRELHLALTVVVSSSGAAPPDPPK